MEHETSDLVAEREQVVEYQLYEPGEVDMEAYNGLCQELGVNPDTNVHILPFGEHHRVGYESRKLYFALALQSIAGHSDAKPQFNDEPVIQDPETKTSELPVNRIISFGECNVACPYCKRDCQFIGESGLPEVTIEIPLLDVLRVAVGAEQRGETVRLSGGDPVTHPQQSLLIARYIYEQFGQKSSIAHNGSGTAWVNRMAPYLSSAAIDLKATPEKFLKLWGLIRVGGQ